jgi:hypothetical protein
MTYTKQQIENAKRNYNNWFRLHTLADYNVAMIGTTVAEERMEFHNKIVKAILSGDKEEERAQKMFFLNQEVEADRKAAASKAKKEANKAASADILKPIKEMRKIGEFGKWLNNKNNEYRRQHFNKKYTVEAVNAFIETL